MGHPAFNSLLFNVISYSSGCIFQVVGLQIQAVVEERPAAVLFVAYPGATTAAQTIFIGNPSWV
jgi:hypothetical protein